MYYPTRHTSFRVELTSLDRVELTPPLPIDLPGGVPEPSVLALLGLAPSALVARRFV